MPPPHPLRQLGLQSQPKDASDILGDVLVHCLDAAGLSIGLLYVVGPDGRPRLQAQFGISARSSADAETCFGHADLIQRTLEGGEPFAFSSATEDLDAQRRDFLARLGHSSVLVVPFVVVGQTFGELVLASDSHDLSEKAWLGVARSLALQFGPTVALGQSLKRIADFEERSRAITPERQRGEEALRRSEARMESVLDAALDAVIMMDAEGRVTSWNRRAEELFGWPRGEAVGRTLSELITVADITERKRTEEALREAQRRFEHVVSSSPAVLYSLKPDGQVLHPMWASPNLERLLGYAPDEVRLSEEWSDRIHPDDRQRVVAEIATLLSDGYVAREYRFRHKDGSYRWLRDQQRLLRDAEGHPTEVVGSWSDVTALKEAELQLQESEEQYRVLFDSNPHPMYVFDAETLDFLAVNDAAVHHYGYSREELLGMTVQEVCPPEEVPTWMRAFHAAEAVRDRSQTLGVFKHRKKDGTPIQMEVEASRIRLRGRADWLVLAMDVTEKRSLEAQLLQSQKIESVGRLAGGVAHDFNNILGVITGYAELLRRRLPAEPPQWRKYVDDILKAAARAAGLTRQLLAFSRSQVLQPRILDLNEVVAEMEKMLRRLIGEDVRLVTVFDAKLPLIKADAGQLEQVLMNLAVNARDAMPRGGCLTIETDSAALDERYAAQHAGVRPGRYAMLAVSDTGHGMPPEVQARLFEPFFTTKEPGKGTGLGLATVHGIVKQSGGHVFVYSEIGSGTVFKVYLPLVEETSLPAELAVDETSPRGTETVLIVEDEGTLREIIRECLESSGYVVLEAPEASAAIETCDGYPGPIHLLISDVVMPGAGGRELANQLAARRPDMKVLFMSGYTDDAVILHGVLTRDMPFLEKPFTADALARKVREVLDRA